jgi:hypothetical protein
MFAMHCDQAECLTEASRGSITEQVGKQKEWVVRGNSLEF